MNIDCVGECLNVSSVSECFSILVKNQNDFYIRLNLDEILFN